MFSKSLLTSLLLLSSTSLAAPLSQKPRNTANPESYPYEFINFLSIAAPGTSSNYTGLWLRYDLYGPNGNSDTRPLSLNATPTGIPWTLNTLWTSPDPHNGTLSFRVPDSCDDVEFCTGGIALSPATTHEVQAVNRYSGDAAFWLDFHNGTKDTYDAANPPSLRSDAKVFYACDTQLNGEEHFYQIFWANKGRGVPKWCGEVELEAHYPF